MNDRQSRELLLKMYAGSIHHHPKQDFFLPILLLMLLLAGSAGWYLKMNNPPHESLLEKISKIETTFIIEEKPVPKPVEKPKAVEKKAEVKKEIPLKKEEPIDLTEKPLLDQNEDDIVKQSTEEPQKKVRRVYGLKKVYSTGIGASGDASDAVIGKLGNTLNTEIDTFTVTKEELKGSLVSITAVTTMPVLKNVVKPEYTKEMLENRVEGVVRVKVQVDIDGIVKKAVVLDDLGFGTKEKTYEACLKLIFEPARVGDKPVASWITISIRFAMLG